VLITDTADLFFSCTICPGNCGANRALGEEGRCKSPAVMRIARAARHDWEEPCISGTKGSGAIFFSGCPLGCVFCQNFDISRGGKGREVSSEHLREIISGLEKSGVHNINLVTAGHYAPLVIEALTPRPGVPVVWNSSGYESVDTLKSLKGRVQVYLPDLKYSDNSLALRYSGAPDYFETAAAAIREMYRQTGPYVLDNDGIIKSGVVIRHLILPNALKNSFGVLDWVAGSFKPGEILFSLMSQYIPQGNAKEYPEISRKITKREYEAVKRRMYKLGIEDGYIQDLRSAQESYIPAFDLEGIAKALQSEPALRASYLRSASLFS